MHFLRTLFWVILAVAGLIFAWQNNKVVTVNLWGGLQADIKLWLLVFAPFLLGFLPTWIFHRASLWQRRRQADSAVQRASEVPGYAAQTSITPDGTMSSSQHSPPPVVSPSL